MDTETVWQADAVALADRISALLTVARSAEAEIGTLLAEIESRGVMELFGYRSVARLLEHLADVPKSAAETVVKRARALTPSRALDGTPIPAVAPATGAAASEGRLSNPMIDTIVGVMTHIPPEHRDDAEQHLLSFASEAWCVCLRPWRGDASAPIPVTRDCDGFRSEHLDTSGLDLPA